MRKGKKMKTPMERDSIWGYIFVAPQVIGYIVMIAIPLIMVVLLCFSKWDMLNPPVYVGLRNFRRVFINDGEILLKAITNTLVLIFVTVPLTLATALGLAVLCNRKIRGLNFFKAAFFLPMVTSSVSLALVWFWIFAPDFGVMNIALSAIGITGPGWLTDPAWAKVAIIIMSVWLKTGYYFIILYAGLKGIPDVYYEAAEIDGAPPFLVFRKITIPMLSPIILFSTVMLSIDFFNLFDVPFILTRGGPAYSTYTMVMHVYNQAFQSFDIGMSSVSSLVLFAMTGLITYLQFVLSKRMVNFSVE